MENTEEINFKTQENTSKIPQSLLSKEEKAKKRHEGFKKFEKAAISEENIKKANDIMLEQSKLFGALQELVRDDKAKWNSSFFAGSRCECCNAWGTWIWNIWCGYTRENL